MKKLIVLLCCFLFTQIAIFAQDPYNGYYNNAIGKKGTELKNALYDIIKNNLYLNYRDLWTHYGTTDVKADGTTIWDIYSDIPDGTAPYEFTFSTDQCDDSGSDEGVCYNREHSVPNSWFGGSSTQYEPIYTDLFHLYPTDACVNNKRANNPYGEVANPTWTSQNGSKLGDNTYSADYTGTAFEPIDAFKGDLARTYFYMSLRYKDKNFSQKTESCFNGATLKPWALAMFKEWHEQDTVSEKERIRNNKVQNVQNNRNPFIDYPQLVEYLWGTYVDSTFMPYQISKIEEHLTPQYTIFPNPAKEKVEVLNPDLNIERVSLFNMLGEQVLRMENVADAVIILNVEALKPGVYFLKIEEKQYSETQKIILQ